MQGMRDLLRGSLARSLRTLPDEDRLAAALPVVFGSALASHCEVDRLDEEQALHLRVRGREWMGPLVSMREVLRGDLARAAGVTLRGLHFQVARGLPAAEASRRVAGRPAEGLGEGTAGFPPRDRRRQPRRS